MSQYISTYKSLRECESAESASLFITTTEVSKAKPKTQNENLKPLRQCVVDWQYWFQKHVVRTMIRKLQS